MVELAASVEPADLQRRGFRLYERFRPDVPAGESGWGAKGELDLAKVRGRAGPFGMLAVVVRLRHLATVFGLSPKRAAKAAGRLLRRQELGPNARRRAC